MKATTTPRKRKLQSGFTLVEVIVVAVIVAILAGVSVPLYLNYIENSRLNQATNAAGSAASFLAACKNGGATTGVPAAGSYSNQTIVCTGGVGDSTSFSVPPNIRIQVTANNVTGYYVDGGTDVAGPSNPYNY